MQASVRRRAILLVNPLTMNAHHVEGRAIVANRLERHQDRKAKRETAKANRTVFLIDVQKFEWSESGPNHWATI